MYRYPRKDFKEREVIIKNPRGQKAPHPRRILAKWKRGFLGPSGTIAGYFLT